MGTVIQQSLLSGQVQDKSRTSFLISFTHNLKAIVTTNSIKPATKYAKSGSVNIAYQVFGTGTIDLVYIPGWISNIDLMWACPELVYFLQELGKIARVFFLINAVRGFLIALLIFLPWKNAWMISGR